jgi:DMSO/TMAO reductase YedYZ molybdopterin-dependent catalytic subunit
MASGKAFLSHTYWHAQDPNPPSNMLLEGADTGSLSLGSKVLPYSQIVPVSKCLEENSLIAYKLNNRFLPRRNGFPARALLPGWYAMDSLKWLRRIVLLAAAAEATQFYDSGPNVNKCQ